jgi:hypothetical protein
MAAQLHEVLATASLGVVLLVAAEGVWRGIHSQSPGRLSAALGGLLLLALGVTSAGGLGLLVGGARPRETLHFVYAMLALGAVPTLSSLTRQATPRQQGLMTALVGGIALAVIARLFGTG